LLFSSGLSEGVLIFDTPIREDGLAEQLARARKVILFKETIFRESSLSEG
jgi:hypothetical protein